MRTTAIALILFSLLLLGCSAPAVKGGNASNVSNGTVNNTMNETPPAWKNYVGTGFSFDYPSDMNATDQNYARSGGIFTARHELESGTGEILAVLYINTNDTYGSNKDAVFRLDPSKTSADFLSQDEIEDPTGFLVKVGYMGNISTYAIGRDVFVSEFPFILLTNSGTKFTGYAIDIYIPDRSLLLRTRIIALDPAIAQSIRQNFLLTFRPE